MFQDPYRSLIPRVTVGESIGFADPPVGVQIAELDGGNPYPEVVVSFYTGGAHCCSATSVLTASPDGSKWTTVDLGQFDGGPLLATVKDVTGDARFAPAHAAWLKTMIENVPEEGSDVNGFLAGYVGEKIPLGEGKQDGT